MPGRHGKQRVMRKKSKKGPPRISPMQKLVSDSFFNRQRKETAILSELVPLQRVEVKRVSSAAAAGAAPATAARGKLQQKKENWAHKSRFDKPRKKKQQPPEDETTAADGADEGDAGDAKETKKAQQPAGSEKKITRLTARGSAEKLLQSLARNK